MVVHGQLVEPAVGGRLEQVNFFYYESKFKKKKKKKKKFGWAGAREGG